MKKIIYLLLFALPLVAYSEEKFGNVVFGSNKDEVINQLGYLGKGAIKTKDFIFVLNGEYLGGSHPIYYFFDPDKLALINVTIFNDHQNNVSIYLEPLNKICEEISKDYGKVSLSIVSETNDGIIKDIEMRGVWTTNDLKIVVVATHNGLNVKYECISMLEKYNQYIEKTDH